MAQSNKDDHQGAFSAGSEERVTVSSVPISRESRVAVASLRVEAAWLDRLVVAACEMPVASGEAAVVEFLVRALSEIFPECGVGACFVPQPPPSASTPDLHPTEQRLFKYVPEGEERRAVGMDPTRLFPGYQFERVLDVEAGATTLHLASDDPQLEVDGSPMMHVVRRGVLAMSRGLAFARVHARATADARELRALSSHMMQAEKLASLGQLAAGVVHELNNPLTSIVAYTDWLIRKQGPSGDPDSIERLRRIGESSTRILRFTRDLVAYARPSSEVPVLVAIHNVIEQALAFCEHVIAEHGANVERVFADQLPPVRGMPEQLAQVFVNLFTNACHAMPETGGRLGVSSTLAPDGRVVVAVEDNGHGIAGEHLTSIFTPFFTTKGDGRGTGLGLSIVRNIMDNHSAEIRAERSPEGGARFVLMFPSGT
ncbi:MAG: two-component sensor histidine kinase [Labilithrix sp.]|nr:two-component sensor histidine kinase [Labilithrix sp.]MBX3221257.1 two-component sensor histidine kinase [Labilithrix sp.]